MKLPPDPHYRHRFPAAIIIAHHHIPRQQRKVTNWRADEASLRQRGSLTVLVHR